MDGLNKEKGVGKEWEGRGGVTGRQWTEVSRRAAASVSRLVRLVTSQPPSHEFSHSNPSRQSGMVQPVVQEMLATVHAASSSLLGLFSSCTTIDSTSICLYLYIRLFVFWRLLHFSQTRDKSSTAAGGGPACRRGAEAQMYDA
eukprot:scaffold26732_cov126-Isochrysis_galbana.AAC.3